MGHTDRGHRTVLALAAGIALVSTLAGPLRAGGISFTRVADAANPVVSDPGHAAGAYFGASWVDLDGDADLDLWVDQTQAYRNLGGGNFESIAGSGLADGQFSSGFTPQGNSWGDYDNDGDADAFMASLNSFLYRNDGATFTQIVTGDIGDGFANRGWTPAFGDYDNDGNLDLVIVHPATFIGGGPALPNHMFHGDGPPDYGFTRVTTGPIVTGLDSYTVGTWADYDDDGDLDFFIGSGPANGTTQPDNLYRNLLTETGTADFERIEESPIATDLQDGQVWNWIDVDNDGDLDAYVTNWGGPLGGLANRLYIQASDGTFSAPAAGPIMSDVSVSLASIWGDYDNDGDLDCVVLNDGSNANRLYVNDGTGTFTSDLGSEVANGAFASRGGAAADYDDDGDLDLFVNGAGANRRLLRNDTGGGNHWLRIDVEGTISNRSGIGAKVRVKATLGGTPTWMRRDISAQNSFNGHSSQVAHFGLGDAAVADSIVVAWPSGLENVLTDVAADQRIRITEPGSVTVPGSGDVPSVVSVTHAPNPTRGATTVRLMLDQAAAVSVTVHDVAGRQVRRLQAGTALAAGAHALTWDGTADDGHPVPAGAYFTRVEVDGQTSTHRVTLVR